MTSSLELTLKVNYLGDLEDIFKMTLGARGQDSCETVPFNVITIVYILFATTPEGP